MVHCLNEFQLWQRTDICNMSVYQQVGICTDHVVMWHMPYTKWRISNCQPADNVQRTDYFADQLIVCLQSYSTWHGWAVINCSKWNHRSCISAWCVVSSIAINKGVHEFCRVLMYGTKNGDRNETLIQHASPANSPSGEIGFALLAMAMIAKGVWWVSLRHDICKT